MQLFVLQFLATDEFQTTACFALELQWHTCKNTHQLLILLSPVRSGAAESEALGTQLPPPTAAPAAPTAFLGTEPQEGLYRKVLNRKGSLAGFKQTPNPFKPCLPKERFLSCSCVVSSCAVGAVGAQLGGGSTLCCIHPAPSHAD